MQNKVRRSNFILNKNRYKDIKYIFIYDLLYNINNYQLKKMTNIIWIDNNLLCKITHNLKDKYICICTKDLFKNVKSNYKIGDIFCLRKTEKTYERLGIVVSFIDDNKIAIFKLSPLKAMIKSRLTDAITNKNMDSASRKITKILRHQIKDYDLTMTKEGYVSLFDIYRLNLKELQNIYIDDIKEIVATSEKKRLELKSINEKENRIFIRATQGHNLIVGNMIDDNLAFKHIDLSTHIQYIYHGTKYEYLDLILKDGLKRMNRKHIHFVENINRDKQISGFKKISNAILKIDMKKCMEDGIVFYKSTNDVILTEGIDGIIPTKYIVEQIYY